MKWTSGARAVLVAASFATILLGPVALVWADDVGVSTARLREMAPGRYALEVDASAALVPLFRPPVAPEGFTVSRPRYRQVGVVLVVRYELESAHRVLEPGDALLLPWGRSALLLTARWRDGAVHRGMFPRGPSGIRIPIDALRPVDRSPLAVAFHHFRGGFDDPRALFLRLLLALALVAVSSSVKSTSRLALLYALGHGLALVGTDWTDAALPGSLALACLCLGTALLFRLAILDRREGVGLLVVGLGTVEGLGLVSPHVAGPERLPALFGAALATILTILVAVALLTAAWRAPKGAPRPVLVALGSLAVAAIVTLFTTGLDEAHGGPVDPADRLAAARFEFAGTTAGPGSPGGQAPAAPRRLESPAMLFVTIEPNEVRVELLLGLSSFLEPLRIAGEAGSVVPVDLQDAIASRAREMVAKGLSLAIDGRPARPLLTRTDFVTVEATGVTTRTEPRPEPLTTAVLGVTVVYGVDRPPSEVEAGWAVFPPGTTAVPAVWTDPGGSDRVSLTAEAPTLRWANDLSGFETPLPRAVEVQARRWPLPSLLLLGLASLAWAAPARFGRWRPAAWGIVAVALALYPFARQAVAVPGLSGGALTRASASQVLDDLLTNVYRSFDLRDEEAIYDRLALSVTGQQLSDVYLENRRALELENRGGARARVDEVRVLEIRAIRADGAGGYRVDATWTVAGSVNHFGHVHYRQNRYDAGVHVMAQDGVWKISRIEVVDERRVL